MDLPKSSKSARGRKDTLPALPAGIDETDAENLAGRLPSTGGLEPAMDISAIRPNGCGCHRAGVFSELHPHTHTALRHEAVSLRGFPGR